MAVCLKHVDMDWIRDESELPPGFANLSSLYPTPEKARDRERVRRGISLGKVKPVRLVKKTKDADHGPLYVNVKQAADWLESDHYMEKSFGESAGVRKPTIVPPTLGRPLDLNSSRTAAALERIAEALENMATHPKSGCHSPFDRILEAPTNAG
jgi:hypothetical protein